MTDTTITRLSIKLDRINPPPTRVIEVLATTPLDQLHLILQAAMGWENCHLWEFRARNTRWAPINPDGSGEDDTVDAATATLADLIGTGSSDLTYIYDFGDYWQHVITVEEQSEAKPGMSYPRLISAEGACPPEDVGGEPGYEMFLEAINDPSHPEYARLKAWAGRVFIPYKVDIDKLKRDLAALARK